MATKAQEPHHHVIRRTGTVINKHLNLADEALVSRLIAKGCISDNDKAKYTGRTKLARNRFITRLQNQPYKVFLAFVECLKEDTKYSELVAVLEATLAEFDCTPPMTTSETTAPEDSISLDPSPTTTG